MSAEVNKCIGYMEHSKPAFIIKKFQLHNRAVLSSCLACNEKKFEKREKLDKRANLPSNRLTRYAKFFYDQW